MDCGNARQVMVAHLGHSETSEEWQSLRHHLRSCPDCRAEAEECIRAWHALAALPDAEVPSGAWERIRAQLPVPEAARWHVPWPAAATAVLGLVLSILASLAFPYERVVALCTDGLRALMAASLPDPAAFFAVGFLYGLLPLGLSAIVVSRRLKGRSGYQGIVSGVIFMVLALPYVIIACGGLPPVFTGALVAGMAAGALLGGPSGLWAGGRLLRAA